MPQFCLLFYAILQSWQPKGGAMAQWAPLNTPLLASVLVKGLDSVLAKSNVSKLAKFA